MQQLVEKSKEALPEVWEKLANIDQFLEAAIAMNQTDQTATERLLYLNFLIYAFQSLENPIVRKHVGKLVHLALWKHLTPARLKVELLSHPEIEQYWKKLQKQVQRRREKGEEYMKAEANFIPNLVATFLHVLGSINENPSLEDVTFCERFVELMTDLLSQLPTRRFFRIYLEDRQLYTICQLSALYEMEEGKLFRDLLGILRFYLGFEIDDVTGAALDNNQMKLAQSRKLIAFQRVCFKHFPDKLRDLALANLGLIETRKALRPFLDLLDGRTLAALSAKLALLPPIEDGAVPPTDDLRYRKEHLLENLLQYHEKRLSQLDEINALSLYPNEKLLWDYNMVPELQYTGEKPLALPKLNLQFLTFHDYLLRNFNLFRLESTYEIREDIEDALRRLAPRRDLEGKVYMKTPWRCRMALQIEDFAIKYVGPANIGKVHPNEVRAVITVDLASLRGDAIRREWESIRQHDVIFLVGLDPPQDKTSTLIAQLQGQGQDFTGSFKDIVKYVRGAEVYEIRDERDNVFTGVGESKVQLTGDRRHFRVHLDCSQYHSDLSNGLDCYSNNNFHVVVRRKPKENNFKAVLETIRDLMNTQCVVPQWMVDVFLGYGEPDSASYRKLPNPVRTIDFVDSLLDINHVHESFGLDVVAEEGTKDQLKPPFLITFPSPLEEAAAAVPVESEQDQLRPRTVFPTQQRVTVRSKQRPNEGPYPQDQPKMNTVRFTPVQVDALKSAANLGLTMVVGPPGTGKTDVAVQIISNIYHNFPEQRTLVVTHSNSALNDIFSKIAEKDVDERHLLRLGMGYKDVYAETAKDFSKAGRVDFMLRRRQYRLQEVERLSKALGIGDALGDVAHTCETAAHFYRHHILGRWERYCQQRALLAAEERTNEFIRDNFPFTAVFDDVPQLFDWSMPYDANDYVAEGCWRHISKIFEELEDCRAFELFRSAHDRGNYLLCRQARVIAMTCTHAALKRRDLVKLGFEYDNIVMEESAQILEIETFIPMLLQNPQPDGSSRLKRIVLIGDHHQLPPVVKNLAFQRYSHMDQSLFTRFVRLGVPTIQLNAQGRMRPSIADLYRWVYKDLRDFPAVGTEAHFTRANAGLTYEYQMIDVPAYNGEGERQPQPHFFQNLGEAEFVVSMYMYMRLLGYPAEKITILTTYNGQKYLIRDVLNHRCGADTIFGPPPKVTTVDKFQGRQNDYVLLSLVRTDTSIGHIRDVRRLIVAVSRARLGLYVFCRVGFFKNVPELKTVFEKFLMRPTKLCLNLQEMQFPTERPLGDNAEAIKVDGLEMLGALVGEMTRARIQLEAQKYEAQQGLYQEYLQREEERKHRDEAKRVAELERQEELRKRRRIREIKRMRGEELEEEEDDEEIERISAAKRARMDT
eukprot:TRINITY_DN1576_c0_g1_i1.p1 TRINITY_DN1576_c0_g1~~TRINITY_DN1576_c0_g1_i1.p1  ORF type:complete len:1408 (-),score=401.30 TRINITY_DN1576_c0_g1_i1:99-4226(-)